jgi:hypothetical protein
LAVLKLAVLVSGVLALAKLGFLDFITGGFDTGRFGGLPGVRHQEKHIFSLGNTRKYQEILKNFRKYLEISGNTCKFQEIL